MQTELRLFQIPDIDTSILSGVGEFQDRIDTFERYWGMKLEFSPNARWLPGSYERLKGQVVKSLFPNWEKPRGANTIRKLTRYDNYTLGNLQKALIEIDDELRSFRANKICLEGGKASEEGQALLLELMDNYSKVVSDVYVDITPVPYWYRGRYAEDRISHGPPIVPIIDWEGLLPNPLVGYGNASRSPKSLKERMADAAKSKNPKRWYMNIIVNLHKVVVHYFKNSSENDVLAQIPWGSLHVGFTIPLYDLVMNYRRISTGVNLNKIPLNTTNFSGHTYKFPYIPGVQHPFVHRSRNNETNNYEWGNTCFGSWKSEVITALSTGNVAHLKAILILWSESYHCNNTSPLNQPEQCHLGQHVDWEQDVSSYLRTSPTACRTAVQAGYTTVKLLEDNCTVCTLRETGACTYNEELTYVPYEMPKEFLNALSDKLAVCNDLNNEWISKYTVILRLTQKMWNMRTRTTDAQFNSWFYIQDYGTGFMNYENFLTELVIFNGWKDCHYKKQPVEWDAVVDRMIVLYSYAERIYWIQCVRNYNETAYSRLADEHYFEWLEDAQEQLPLDELQSMVHTYRLQRGEPGNEPTYSAYLIDIYQLNQAMENNQQSFDEAVEEVQRLEDLNNPTDDLPNFIATEETEGPF